MEQSEYLNAPSNISPEFGLWHPPKMSAVKSNLNGLVIEILSIYQKQTVLSVNSLLFSDSLRDEKTIMS